MRKLNYAVLREDILGTPETSSVYIGCDSKSLSGHTLFGLVVIIHIESSRGGRCYAEKTSVNRKMDIKERLIKEVELSINCAFEIHDVIGPRNFEIHMDINPDRRFKSHALVGQATGYVSAQGFDFRIKPHAFAATTAADYIIQ